ncbi:hypothetical protein ACFVXH_40210 [Kitasatospora sp. NPDC058184]|uniref:hypothetical protein n=1 Tax=Kitasatospora sp. NPDC058184 TaxID=3346370 RepID=UPI0036DB8682
MPARRKPLQTDDPRMVAFVRLLREVVASTGLPVAELAERVRLPRSTIYRALGGTLPKTEFLACLLDRVGPLSSWSPGALRSAQIQLEQLRGAIAERRRAVPRARAPRVRVPPVPEQVDFALRFAAYLDTLERRGVDLGSVGSEAWLRRYASGASLPGPEILESLSWMLSRVYRIDDREVLAELVRLAEGACRARTEARRWDRVLRGGSP